MLHGDLDIPPGKFSQTTPRCQLSVTVHGLLVIVCSNISDQCSICVILVLLIFTVHLRVFCLWIVCNSSIMSFKSVISHVSKVRSLVLLPDDVICMNRFGKSYVRVFVTLQSALYFIIYGTMTAELIYIILLCQSHTVLPQLPFLLKLYPRILKIPMARLNRGWETWGMSPPHCVYATGWTFTRF